MRRAIAHSIIYAAIFGMIVLIGIGVRFTVDPLKCRLGVTYYCY